MGFDSSYKVLEVDDEIVVLEDGKMVRIDKKIDIKKGMFVQFAEEEEKLPHKVTKPQNQTRN